MRVSKKYRSTKQKYNLEADEWRQIDRCRLRTILDVSNSDDIEINNRDEGGKFILRTDGASVASVLQF